MGSNTRRLLRSTNQMDERSAGPIAFTTAPLRGIGRIASTVQPLHVGAATPRALRRPHVGRPPLIALQTLVMDACRRWPDQRRAVAPIRAVIGPIDLMGAGGQSVYQAHGLDLQAADGIGDCHIVRPSRESKGGKRGFADHAQCPQGLLASAGRGQSARMLWRYCSFWRSGRESNPHSRICSPLHHHSATGPEEGLRTGKPPKRAGLRPRGAYSRVIWGLSRLSMFCWVTVPRIVPGAGPDRMHPATAHDRS